MEESDYYYSFTHSKPSMTVKVEKADYIEAIYQHPKGFAKLYAQSYNKKENDYSSIDFIWQGKWHIWSFKKRYTAKGLARKAFYLINELTKN